MPTGVRLGGVAVGVGKVLAFAGAIFLVQQMVVFTGLGALSARYWSRYDGRGLNEPWFLSSSLACLLVVLLVCLAFLKLVDKKRWSFLGFRTHHSLRLFGVGVLVSLAATGTLLLFAVGTGAANIAMGAGPPIRSLSYVLLMLTGGFALVVQEEVVYRGYALRVLETHSNATAAVIATALLFGLSHLSRAHVSPLGVLNICLMGGVLGLACTRSGNLWLPIGLHFGWNSCLYILDFPVSGATYPNVLFDLEVKRHGMITGTAFGPEDSVVVTVLLTALLAAAWAWRRADPISRSHHDLP